MIATSFRISGPIRTVGVVIGVVFFVTGLVIHILTYTRHVPAEKKKQLGIIAVLQMVVGATMAMWPFMMDLVARSQE